MLQDNSFSNISADYYLIDELHPHEGKKDAIAEGILNCVTALIEVERSKDKNNLEEVLRKLSTKLNTKEKLDGFRTFLSVTIALTLPSTNSLKASSTFRPARTDLFL